MSPPRKLPGRRNLFKQKDVVRAMRSAKAAGLAIGGIEVVTKDGITIRVLAKNEADQSAGKTDTPAGILNQL
jgi:hypothetical protein